MTGPESAMNETSPNCPKCSSGMVLAAVTPHQIVAQMERHTFLCSPCNQTRTYMLLKK
jgi:transposase-like protein